MTVITSAKDGKSLELQVDVKCYIGLNSPRWLVKWLTAHWRNNVTALRNSLLHREFFTSIKAAALYLFHKWNTPSTGNLYVIMIRSVKPSELLYTQLAAECWRDSSSILSWKRSELLTLRGFLSLSFSKPLQVLFPCSQHKIICNEMDYLQWDGLSAMRRIICNETDYLQWDRLSAMRPIICNETDYLQWDGLSAMRQIICNETDYLQWDRLSAMRRIICNETGHMITPANIW